jgi:DNA primase
MSSKTSWVDFKLVKDTVTIQMVIDHYNITGLKKSGNELRGACPLHKGEGKRTFHVNTIKSVFNCFSCSKRGNVLDFVAAMEQCSVRDAAVKLADWFAVGECAQPDKGIRIASGQRVARSRDKDCKPPVINPPLGFQLRIDPAHEYGLNRGLSQETIETFGIGYCVSKATFAGRYLIPLHNESGQLVGYAGRALDEATEPRYLFPSREKGFYKSHLLFNLNRVLAEQYDTGTKLDDFPLSGAIVVVEGFFTTMKISSASLPECVAALGSVLSEVQADLLCKYFQRAILLGDGDEAGRRFTDEAVVKLVHRGMWVKCIDLPEGVQPDHLSSEELRELLLGPDIM